MLDGRFTPPAAHANTNPWCDLPSSGGGGVGLAAAAAAAPTTAAESRRHLPSTTNRIGSTFEQQLVVNLSGVS